MADLKENAKKNTKTSSEFFAVIIINNVNNILLRLVDICTFILYSKLFKYRKIGKNLKALGPETDEASEQDRVLLNIYY